MRTEDIEVESIHCTSCEKTIRAGLTRLDGIEQVTPDHRTQMVAVTFDPRLTDIASIRARLVELGFPPASAPAPVSAPVLRWWLLVGGVGFAGLVGYLAYVAYPRFDLGGADLTAAVGLGAVAGVASFFSPCSFPLLLAILARREGSVSRLSAAAATAGGAAVFLMILGSVLFIGGGALVSQVTFDSPVGIALRVVVGVVLVGLGLMQAGVLVNRIPGLKGVSSGLLRRQASLRRRRPVIGHALFGFSYVLAGFG